MKLLRKLLPLAMVGTAAASITPFITSCNSEKVYSASWNYQEGVYAYTTGKHAAKQLVEGDKTVGAQATDMYFEAAEANPLMFAEDVVQKMSYYQLIPVKTPNVPMVPLTADIKVSKIVYDNKINTITETGIAYVTFTVDFTGIMGRTYGDDIVFDTYGEGHVELNNVGFYIKDSFTEQQRSYEYFWDIEPALLTDGGVQIQTEDWTMSVDMNIPAVGSKEHYNFSSEDLVWGVASTLASSVSPDYCYYLNDVKGEHLPSR